MWKNRPARLGSNPEKPLRKMKVPTVCTTFYDTFYFLNKTRISTLSSSWAQLVYGFQIKVRNSWAQLVRCEITSGAQVVYTYQDQGATGTLPLIQCTCAIIHLSKRPKSVICYCYEQANIHWHCHISGITGLARGKLDHQFDNVYRFLQKAIAVLVISVTLILQWA